MSETKKESGEFQRLPLIPKELHSEFKMVCVKHGITMQSGAEEAIKDYIKKRDK